MLLIIIISHYKSCAGQRSPVLFFVRHCTVIVPCYSCKYSIGCLSTTCHASLLFPVISSGPVVSLLLRLLRILPKCLTHFHINSFILSMTSLILVLFFYIFSYFPIFQNFSGIYKYENTYNKPMKCLLIERFVRIVLIKISYKCA